MSAPRNPKATPSTVRAIVAIFTFLLTAGLGPPSAPAAPSLREETFHFAQGTRWTYEGNHNGIKKVLTQEVLRVSTKALVHEGEPATVFHLAVRTLDLESGGFELDLTTSYLALENGYLATGSQGGPPVRIYKLNSKKGETWACLDPRIGKLSDLEFTHLGEEEVTVPAGSFRNARHIQLEIQLEGSRHVGDLYIVPRIGVLKSRTLSETYGKRNEVVLELKKFSPAREY